MIDAQQNKKFTVIDPGSLATVFVQINLAPPTSPTCASGRPWLMRSIA